MRVRIKHLTTYRYAEAAAFGPHVVRLRPAEHAGARLLTYNLSISPDCEVRWQHDTWANRIARLTFPENEKFDSLEVTVDAAFDLQPVNPFDFFVDDRCEEVPFSYPDGLNRELAPFIGHQAPGPKLAAFIETVPFSGRSTDYLVALNQRVASTVRYIIRNEAGIQTSEETLTLGQGSCRDSAVLLVDVLRARGLAARFVSGYLIQLTDEGVLEDVPRGMKEDVVDLHAWAEVYLPGAGWIGLDGTSGLFCGEGHIPVASAMNPELAAPIVGTSSSPATGFSFDMQVARLGHEPRPRKPYTEESWAQILRCGDQIDATLLEEGLSLTSGGEPTWTSRTHPEEDEWNTAALGETKWQQGVVFAKALRNRMGSGTLLMHNSGKQYPGESLPRWALRLLWRNDGVPIWRDPKWLAFRETETEGLSTQESSAEAHQLMEKFGNHLSTALDLPSNWIPGYEDPVEIVRVEENLPDDVDPLTADLNDGEERRRLARVLRRGLGHPTGFALPIQWWNGRWVTDQWTFRPEHMFLVPGDSPMGLRLPLDRLPGAEPEPWVADLSVGAPAIDYDPRKPKAPRKDAQGKSVSAQPDVAQRTVEQIYGDSTVLRTALCLEIRDGALSVFVPPLAEAEAFLELIAACEDAAKAFGKPIRIEGYPPPHDPRLESCMVTPDPGVIEVNLPVCTSFKAYVGHLETLAEEANRADLCSEKYQIDGREAGSGGGNHLTLGGPTAVESPFLKSPQLLASMLRYVQNHPALSYLFTGLFVGPTSQAPRMDEGRMDALDELDLALKQVPKRGEETFPWVIDRLLRNLMIDVSGNTHRTEICIDKLYAPEGPAGRLGILEFRAFEMPPNERMAAVQMLLLRSLVARFAKEPYEAELVPWGTALHDEFMLPHRLWRDMKDVTNDLSRLGIPVELEWFQPFLDFRCPVFGTLNVEGVQLELRGALEPWPTLGEEPAGPSVARYVDSSLERLQLRVSGHRDSRYKVTVNGIEIPLRPTGVVGEAVAGIRFRAWQPPHCLQPNIGVHHPLRFDLVDTWAKRSLGACTYHVWHPEGRAYDTPPLTIFEAAARRAQRFTTEGHSPWPAPIRPATPHPTHPWTLDLRRFSVAN